MSIELKKDNYSSYGNYFVAVAPYVPVLYKDGTEENIYLMCKSDEMVLSTEQMEILSDFNEEDNPLIIMFSLKDITE